MDRSLEASTAGCGMLGTNLDSPDAVSQDRPLWSVAAILALGAFGTAMIAQVLVLILNQHTGTTSIANETPLSLARGALIVQAALAILIALALRRSSALRARTLRFEHVSFGTLVASLALTLGIAPIANELGSRVAEAMHVSVDASRWVMTIVHRATRGELVLLGVALTIAPACVEELLFRGLLMGALKGAHRAVQLALPALLFGVFHTDWAQGAATFVLGLGFGFMRMTTGSLLVPMVCHAVYNSIVLFTMRAMSSNEAASHQALGVMAAGLLISLVSAAALERTRRSRLSPGVD